MSTSPNLFQRIRPAVWVFLGALLIQFLILNEIAGSRHFLPDGDDMKFYNDWAQKLMGLQSWREGEPNHPGTAFYGLPGYAYALAGIYTLSGGYDPEFSPYIVAMIQALFHAGTATFLYLLACHVFSDGKGDHSRRGALIGIAAALSWALYTPAQVFSAILMPTSWVVCAFWGTVYWIARIHHQGAASWWRPWLWIGLLMGVVAMLVASILMLLPLVVLAIAFTVGKGKGLGRRCGLVVAAVSVLMIAVYAGCSPAWIHNYFVAKDRVLLSAHDGLNFYLGNHPTATGYTKIPDGLRATQEGLLEDSISIPEKELGRKLKLSEVSAYWKEKGRSFIRENPVAWMRLGGLKIANFWNLYQYDDLSILKLLRDEAIVPPGFRFGYFAAFALPGIVFCWMRFPRSRWVIGAVILLMIALLPVFITERYRLAAAPGVILIAWGGVATFWQSMSRARWGRVAAYLILLGGSVWFTSRITVDIGTWSLDYYKAGLRNIEGAQEALSLAAETQQKGEATAKQGGKQEADLLLDEAKRLRISAALYLAMGRKNMEAAYAYAFNNPEINFVLGNAWFLKGDYERARLCYERAFHLSSRVRPHSGALNNLGLIAVRQKRWGDAEALLKSSLELDPKDAESWFVLATVRRELGNRPGAEDAAIRAERLDPNEPKFRAFREELKTPVP